jgi:hypothetical protein
MNDRKFLLSGEPPEPILTHDNCLQPRFGEPKESGREYRLVPIPNLHGAISDNRVLCQLQRGFEVWAGKLYKTVAFVVETDAVVTPRKVQQLKYPRINGSPPRPPAR